MRTGCTEKPACELPDADPPPDEIRQILRDTRTIAVVGISPKTDRDSHKVAAYLIEHGYDVIPVNPGQRRILGRPCFKSLKDIPFPIDLANLFLNPAKVPPVVEQAVEKGVRCIWMQIGVVHNECAGKAVAAGIRVVMDRCIMREHMKLPEGFAA